MAKQKHKVLSLEYDAFDSHWNRLETFDFVCISLSSFIVVKDKSGNKYKPI
jgi:hypothetical protein